MPDKDYRFDEDTGEDYDPYWPYFGLYNSDDDYNPYEADLLYDESIEEYDPYQDEIDFGDPDFFLGGFLYFILFLVLIFKRF